MKLVFHIGAHKTGTTAIQSVAVQENEELARHGVWYPVGLYPDMPEQHSKVYSELSEAGVLAFKARLEGAVAEARARSCHTLFLSGEDMGSAGMDRAKMFVDNCGNLFTGMEFVLVLRDKRHYFGSHYNHTLSFGQQVLFSDFPKYIQFSPAKTVNIWRLLCGPGAVRVFPYAGDEPLVVRFFRDILQFEVSNPEKYKGINSSIDFLSAFLINTVLKNGEDFDPLKFIRIYSQVFKGERVDFSINERVADQISNLYPREDWVVDGEDWDKKTPVMTDRRLTNQEISGYFKKLSVVLSKYAEQIDHSNQDPS